MSRSRKTTLSNAKKFSNLLLYQATGGIMGSAPPEGTKKVQGITFAEKKALLSELLKLAELENKHKEDDPNESPFAKMKKGVKDGSKQVDHGGSGAGSNEDSGESSSDDDEESGTF